MKTTELVIGRWKEVFNHLNIDVGEGKHQPCPVCLGKDRFRFIDKDGRGTWFCNQCDPQAGDGWSLLMKVRGYDFISAAREVESILNLGELPKDIKKPIDPRPYLKKLYRQSAPLTEECLGGLYLLQRGLSTIPKNGSLRSINNCKIPDTSICLPAILATFMVDGEAVTLHRIFIGKNGKKPDMEKHKFTLPPVKPMGGGAVRLYDINQTENTKGFLGVAEGIETAIAAHELWQIPVWATLSAQLMEKFVVPKGINSVIVFSDNDKNFTGQKAAFNLANRLVVREKLDVSVEIPEMVGDFLDELNNQ